MLENDKIKLENDLAAYPRYRTLWRAVVLQALLDIKSKSNKDLNNINRVKAILWISLNKKDFLDVCQRADINPERVYKCKLKIMEHQKKSLQNKAAQ